MSVSWADQALQATQELGDDTASEQEQPSCTQHVTTTQDSLFRMFEIDPDSVQETGIIARFRDENEKDVFEPKYFFLDNKIVCIGSGYKSDKSEVKFDHMETVGMSDFAFEFSLSEEPFQLSLTSYNSNTVKLHRSTGTIVSIHHGEENIHVYQGDFIHFNDYGKHRGCDITFHNAPEAPANDGADASLEDSTNLLRHRTQAIVQIDSKIASLNVCRNAIEAAADIETVESLLATVDGNLDASESLERKRHATNTADLSE